MKLLGEQAPQLRSAPTYVSSAGPEASALAKSAGLSLDPWQDNFLADALGEDERGNWSSFECGLVVSRQNGKGSCTEARVLAGLNLFGERLIMWSAHETKTSFEAFRRCEDLFTGSDALRKQVKAIHRSNGSEGIELRNGARLRFVARTKGSGRGFSADLIILDEAYALTAEQIAALVPTLSSRPNPQIWYTSSPPLDSLTGDQMFALRDRAMQGDPGLTWYDWGLQGVSLNDLSSVDLDDPEVWRRTNPAMGYRISPDFVARERRAMPDADFARERLGIWPPKPSQLGFRVIPETFWIDALDPDAQLDGRPALGVYIPPDRSYSAIVAAGDRLDGGRAIELTGNDVDGNDYRPGTTWIVPRLRELEKHNPLVLVIDDKAVADEAEKAGLTVHRAGVADVVTGCQLFFDGVAGADPDGRDVKHLGQQEMTDAVAGAVRRKVGNSWAWERHDLTTDVGPIAAASLALFGHATPRVHRRSNRVPMAAFA